MRPLPAALLAALLAAPAWAAPSGAHGRIPEALPGAPPFGPELRRRLAEALAARPAGAPLRTRHLRPDGSPLYTNRLLLEPSPYLRQHAHNPVNWYPWGEEAFAEARRLDRPVLVSIGYSTCHWCHVMEEESFDDPEIAELLNRNVIAIKVDREERPDVDAFYMEALRAMGLGGGWPLHAFATPDRAPFYGGTYFPPEDRDGRPGLRRVLRAVAARYRAERGDLHRHAAAAVAALRRELETVRARSSWVPRREVVDAAVEACLEVADPRWGGIGRRTKFPSRLPVGLLLRHHLRTGDPRSLEAVRLALSRMDAGGIRDHLGGGFHRYSTDPFWRVPHFEKMLYDQALRTVEHLEAFRVTGETGFRDVAREILDFSLRELRDPGGGFYTALDADSPAPDGEPREGFSYTFTPAEIREALPAPLAGTAIAFFAVEEGGPVGGRSVLHTPRSRLEVARELGIPPEELGRRLERIRAALLEVRRRRPPPFRDEKIVAAWNGLMLRALARAAFALDDPVYRAAARRLGAFVRDGLMRDGRLLRVRVGGELRGPAFLEDHAYVIAGLLDLFEADPDPGWLELALALQDRLDADFADEEGGGYYAAPRRPGGGLPPRKPATDGALPSANGVEADNLLRLFEITGREAYRERAELLFAAFGPRAEAEPLAHAALFAAVDFAVAAPLEIVLVSPPGEAGAREERALLRPLRRRLVPHRVVLRAVVPGTGRRLAALSPLVARRPPRGGHATAYLCRARVCDAPTADPAEFARQLARHLRPPDAGGPPPRRGG